MGAGTLVKKQGAEFEPMGLDLVIEEHFEKMQEYAAMIGIPTQDFEFTLTSDGEGYSGQRKVTFDYFMPRRHPNVILIMQQSGRFKHKELTLRELVAMDSHSIAYPDIHEGAASELGDLGDAVLKEIRGHVRYDGIISKGYTGNIYFSNAAGSYATLSACVHWEEQFTTKFKIRQRREKERWLRNLLDGRVWTTFKEGRITTTDRSFVRETDRLPPPSRYGTDIDLFGDFMKDMFTQFDIEDSQIHLWSHKDGSTQNVPYTGPIDPTGLSLYLKLRGNDGQGIFESMKCAYDAVRHLERTFRLNASSGRFNVEDEDVGCLTSIGYALFRSEEYQKLFSRLNDFYEKARETYEPFLGAVETAHKRFNSDK